MTAIGKLFRTTAFRLTLVYLTVFAFFAAFVLFYFAWNISRLITEQITETVDTEIQGLRELYSQGGLRRLVFAIDERAVRPGSNLYLLHDSDRRRPCRQRRFATAGVLDTPGWTETSIAGSNLDQSEHHALVEVIQLAGGFRLLVGRDLEERDRFRTIVFAAGQWSFAVVVLLGLAGGIFVMRRVLKRVDAMTDTARAIMQGDLANACRLRVRATSSIGWPSTSTRCSIVSRRSCAVSRKCPTTLPMTSRRLSRACVIAVKRLYALQK